MYMSRVNRNTIILIYASNSINRTSLFAEHTNMATTSMAKPGVFSHQQHPRHNNDLPFPDFTSIRSRFRHSQLSLFNLRLNHAPNVSLRPVVRAQASPDYAPDVKFYRVEAILRPWRVPQVSAALLKMGIRGVTVSDVRGFGAQGGLPERQAGSEFSEDNFVAKVKMEIVVCKDQVEAVIDRIIEGARTGEIGDGKIFLVPISDVVRVRTGERGEKAERMAGGWADMTSSTAKPTSVSQ